MLMRKIPRYLIPFFSLALISLNTFSQAMIPICGNAAAVASCLDKVSAPPGSDLANVINSLQFAAGFGLLAHDLIELNPALYNGFALAQENTSIDVRTIFSHRGEDLRNSCCIASENSEGPVNYRIKARKNDASQVATPIPSQEKIKPVNGWVTPFGEFSKQHGDQHDTIGFHTQTGGLATGVDYKGELGFGGAGIAYTYTHVDLNEATGRGHIQSGYGGFYGGYTRECVS